MYNRAEDQLAATEEPLAETANAGAKSRAYAASELVECRACARTNPPTRTNCLYCGAALEVSGQTALVSVEPESNSDNAFHVIALASPADPEDNHLTQSASLLNLTPAELRSLLSHSTAAPLFAAQSAKQAENISEKLRTLGIETETISDEQLDCKAAQKEIVALEFEAASLTGNLRRGNEKLSASWRDLALIVVGRLYFATIEIEQKRNRRKDVIEERELIIDEAVLDLYGRDDPTGWRIRAGSFDFSCLGKEKKLTAFENFALLSEQLRQRATSAIFDDAYLRLRAVLNSVWPVEPRSTKESRHTALGDFDSSATISDNEAQFTRYSRMLRHFTRLRQRHDQETQAV